jgi:transposase
VIHAPQAHHRAGKRVECQQAKISAGKRLSTKTGKGNRWLKQALIEASHGDARSKDTYLGAYYQ